MNNFKIQIINEHFQSVEHTIPGATIGSHPEYPSDWFRTAPGLKPPISVPKSISDRESWKKMLGEAIDEKITSQIAVRYLYEYARDHFQEELPDEWTSYGTQIGRRAHKLNPMELLDVKEYPDDWTAAEGAELRDDEKFRLFAIILTGYRYGITSEIIQVDYKQIVLGKINQVITNNPFNLNSDLTLTELSRYKVWYNNPEYKAMIGALDMFWTKFLDSPGAKLRMCNLSSRFKDCTSLGELRHL